MPEERSRKWRKADTVIPERDIDLRETSKKIFQATDVFAKKFVGPKTLRGIPPIQPVEGKRMHPRDVERKHKRVLFR